ncbi:uncharacterized protein [Diabrotica undecimpunctata]|uniref:uncharacterized protein n=1 Tax=Diabrotica undecimpunctata TaxID=50387 RepID=UPI003B632094
MDSCTPSTSTSSEIISGACHFCSKTFKNVKLRNRHIKRMHNIDVSKKKMNHIVCPLCEQETHCESHEKLRKHLKDHHQVSIELITFDFSSKQEYETWKDMQKIETSYAMSRVIKGNDYKILYYECNRSNINGYKPNHKIRTEKSGGSIKIKGVCPSRLLCTLRDQGQVSISYWKTHSGHKEELRTMHLSKAQEKTIVEKLMSGVPPSRILDDSKKVETPKLERLALLTSHDITNLSRKYNIHKKRDQDKVIVKAHKIAEMMKEKVEVKKNVKVYGQFQVKSFRDPNKLYNVSIRQLCENVCKTLFCRVCKICIHRYQCDCAEYVVRNTLCKHVHLVRMYEERVGTNSVLDDAARCMGENSIIKSSHGEEINEFITKKQIMEQRNVIQENTIQQRLQDIQHLKNVLDSLVDLDDESYTQLKEKIMTDVEEAKSKAKEKFQEASKDITKKRKMEKRQYFPSNKKRN